MKLDPLQFVVCAVPEPSSKYATFTIDAHRDSIEAELDDVNLSINALASGSRKPVESGKYTPSDVALELDVFERIIEVGTQKLRKTIDHYRSLNV